VLPYVDEPLLRPVLVAVAGHAVLAVAGLALGTVRTRDPVLFALDAAVLLASGLAVRMELRARHRAGSLTAAIVVCLVLGLVSAWVGDRSGVF
jgi:hypothetical protein